MSVLSGQDGLVGQAVILRLYPSLEQEGLMRQWIGTCRALWNHLLEVQNESYSATHRFLLAGEMEQERQRWEREPGCEWRRSPQSQSRQRIVKELQKAFSWFFRSRKGDIGGAPIGYPKFKKKGLTGTFYLANARMTLDPQTRRVNVHKLGDIKFRGGRMPSGRMLAARVRLVAGRWLMAVQFEAPPPRKYGRPSVKVLGIDVGMKTAVARSDGRVEEAPRFLRKAEKRLRRLDRWADVSVPGSGRQKVKRLAAARLHRRIRDRRADFLHHCSSRAVGKAEIICLETLTLKGLAKGWLAKSIKDAALREFRRQIEYKTKWSGRKLVLIGRFEPTTKTCSSCGQLHHMPLGRRMMACDCGLTLDRDVNAARNIARVGAGMVGEVFAEPGATPTRVEIGDQEPAACRPAPLPVVESRSRAGTPRRSTRGRGPGTLAKAEWTRQGTFTYHGSDEELKGAAIEPRPPRSRRLETDAEARNS